MLNIGKLFIVGFEDAEMSPALAKQLKELNPAGVIFFDQNVKSREQVTKLIMDLKDLLGEKLLISVDQEGGRVQRLRKITTALPSLRDSTKNLLDNARLLATELVELGFNYNFAPCADLDTNPNNPVIGNRSLGSDEKLVSEQVALLIREYERHGLLTCAKHFPGHGDTDKDSHLDLPVLDYLAKYGSMEEYERHLMPFRAAIEAGVDSVMIAHLLVKHLDERLPTSLSARAIQGELRGNLGYGGLVVSDELTMKALSRFGNYTEICKQALIAGNNLVIWNVNLSDASEVAKDLSRDNDLKAVYEDSLEYLNRFLT